MRVGPFILVASLGLFGASRAHAAQPQCSDGIDNDGDGQIDFAGGNFGEAPPDTDCRSAAWNNEASGSDMLDHPFDAGHIDGGVGNLDSGMGIPDGGTIPPGETCDGLGCNPFVNADGGTSGANGGTTGGSTVDPPRHEGCAIGGSSSPTLPILLLLGSGCGLALLSRRTRA